MKNLCLLTALATLLLTGCGKKDDPQSQSSATPYVRLNTQFNGNQGLTWLRGYEAPDCSATVTLNTDPVNPDTYAFIFLAAPSGGDRSEIKITMERTKIKPGAVGTYVLGTDFYVDLKYRPASKSCNNSAFFCDSRARMKTLNISAYDSNSKRITGTFEASTGNIYNPEDCPITNVSQRGDVQVTGEFKSIQVPF